MLALKGGAQGHLILGEVAQRARVRRFETAKGNSRTVAGLDVQENPWRLLQAAIDRAAHACTCMPRAPASDVCWQGCEWRRLVGMLREARISTPPPC